MSWEYLHLIAHSFPIVLAMTGSLVGLGGWFGGRPELERWALIALLVAGVFAIPAYVTGVSAADVVADRTFVRPSDVQDHRFLATWALIPVLTAGVLAGFALSEQGDTRLRRFVIIVGFVASVALGWTAAHGARIQHGDHEPASPGAVVWGPATWQGCGADAWPDCSLPDCSLPDCSRPA